MLPLSTHGYESESALCKKTSEFMTSWSDFVRNRQEQCGGLENVATTKSWDDFVKDYQEQNGTIASASTIEKSWQDFVKRQEGSFGREGGDDSDEHAIEIPLDVHMKKQKAKDRIRWLQKLSKVNCLYYRDERCTVAEIKEENKPIKETKIGPTENEQIETTIESESPPGDNNVKTTASIFTEDAIEIPLDAFTEELKKTRTRNCTEWLQTISKCKCHSARDEALHTIETNESISASNLAVDNKCEVMVFGQNTFETTLESKSHPNKSCTVLVASESSVPTDIFMPKDVETRGTIGYLERRRSLPDELEKKMFELIDSAFVDARLLGGGSSYYLDDDSYVTSPPPSFYVSHTFSDDEACTPPHKGTMNMLPHLTDDNTCTLPHKGTMNMLPHLTGPDNTSLCMSANSQEEVKCLSINEDDCFGAMPPDQPDDPFLNSHETSIDEGLSKKYNSPVTTDLGRPSLPRRVFSSRLRRLTTGPSSSLENNRPAYRSIRVSSTLKHHTVIIGNDKDDKLAHDEQNLPKLEEQRINQAPSPFF